MHQIDTWYEDCPKCSDTRGRLGVTKLAANKVVYHCFNCGDKGVRRIGKSPPKIKAYPIDAYIPEDAEFNPNYWPTEARDWVGDLILEAVKYKWFYTGKSQRVVTPFFDRDGLVWTNARAVMPEHKPKYILRKAPEHKRTQPHYIPEYTEGKIVVLVEDCLSTLRLSRIQEVTPVGCMGTNLPHQHIQSVRGLKPSKVVIMFDNDNWQVKTKQVVAKRKLELYLDCPVNICRLTEDPKNIDEKRLYEYVR